MQIQVAQWKMLLKDCKFKYKILLSKDKLVKDWKVLIVPNLKGKPVFFKLHRKCAKFIQIKKGVSIFELFRSCEFFNVKRDNLLMNIFRFYSPILKVIVLLWQEYVYISMTKIIKTWRLRWLGTYYGQYHREHSSTCILEKITLLLPGNNTATRHFEK